MFRSSTLTFTFFRVGDAGALRGGMLGLFMLGFFAKNVQNFAAMMGIVLGILVIAWLSLFQKIWPLPVPLHTNLSIVIGTTVIFVTGFVVSAVLKKKPADR